MDKKEYIHKLEKNLKKLPKIQREDIIAEIKQNINDGISAGEKEDVIIARLGTPKVLAKAYVREYYVENNKILKAIPFFVFTGISSFIMVNLFGCFMLAFGFGAAMIAFAGIARTFGATWIPMYWGGGNLPQVYSLAFSIPFSALFVLIAFFNWRVLRKYFKFVSSRYKSRR